MAHAAPTSSPEQSRPCSTTRSRTGNFHDSPAKTSPPYNWPMNGPRVLAASILGSGAVFLESTVVNVALPAIARDFHLGMDGLQWVVNAYLLTVGSLILLGGALGDRYARATIFRVGAVGFAI